MFLLLKLMLLEIQYTNINNRMPVVVVDDIAVVVVLFCLVFFFRCIRLHSTVCLFVFAAVMFFVFVLYLYLFLEISLIHLDERDQIENKTIYIFS